MIWASAYDANASAQDKVYLKKGGRASKLSCVCDIRQAHLLNLIDWSYANIYEGEVSFSGSHDKRIQAINQREFKFY